MTTTVQKKLQTYFNSLLNCAATDAKCLAAIPISDVLDASNNLVGQGPSIDESAVTSEPLRPVHDGVLIPNAELLVVTTPQQAAAEVAERAGAISLQTRQRLVGVVENMSGFVCPKCNGESQIFKPSTGGAKKLAEEMDVELLGCVPLDPRIGKSADYGVSFLDEYPDSPASTAYLDIIDSESAALLL